MEPFTNFFELHVGFSTAEQESVVASFVTRMGAQAADWVRSSVKSVHVVRPGCVDPHNVPGTLGSLISRKIFQSTSGWKYTIYTSVIPAVEFALAELAVVGATDARLEIEFPFGCFATTVVDNKIFRSAWTNDPVSIPVATLNFSFGEPLKNVPQWEIHFLLERISRSVGRDMSVEEVSAFIGRYDLEVEQTIQYRSAAMLASGRSDYRLIATSYFPSAVATLTQAEHLFYDSMLCEDAFDRGYPVRLILEHIVTCVQPIVEPKNIARSSDKSENGGFEPELTSRRSLPNASNVWR